jgi:hypothetical protein
MNCKSDAKTRARSGLKSIAISGAGQIVIALGLLMGAAGCKRQDIQVYTVPKEAARPEVAAPAGGDGSAAEGKPSLSWKTPEGWEEVAPGEMRLASFRLKGDGGKQADVSIVPLPGLAGGDVGNVNRWRGQVGLPPVDEAEIAKLAQPVEVAGQSGQLFEQAGKAAGSDDLTRILAVIFRKDGTAWFFKMTGNDDLVAKQKPVFVGFLKTLNFQQASAQPELPPSHPPIESGSIASAKTPAPPTSNSGRPTWQVPAGWQEAPAGQFLVAKFNIAGDANAQAAVNVSMSAGDGGGLAANVNRWRGQLGLPALSPADLSSAVQSLDLPSGKAMLVEMNGTDARTGQASHLVGAIVPKGTQTWFYKLMGNQAVVDREKKAFTNFVETAKY